MKAAVLRRLGEPLDVASGITWEPLKRGQVLVKLAYSGVCHSQVMEARGKRGEDRFLPHLLGHEGSGQVVECGDGVTKVKPGDRVVVGWIKGTGLEAGGARYRLDGETINAGGVTTFNEYAVVSENRVVTLPAGIPMDVAVLFGCAVPTGAGITLNELGARPGSSIAVFGLGGIGMSALMATQLVEASKVIAIDVSDDKLAMARDFGATTTVNASRDDALSIIRELTSGAGVDYAIEAAGATRTIETAFQSVRKNGGLCVFASHPPTGERIQLDPHDLISGKQIRGSWGGASKPDTDIPRMMQLYSGGKLPLERLLSRRYSLDQINEALEDLEAGRVARPVVELDTTLATRS